MRESDIENYLKKQVAKAGGLFRKVKWIGRNGAPDRLVILNRIAFVELKAPGKTPDGHQIKEHIRLRDAGATVFVFDSKVEVDWLIKELCGE